MTDINVRLHAWSTRFHLGLVLSQIACLMLAKLTLRQEDMLNQMALDRSFLFCTSGGAVCAGCCAQVTLVE